MAGAVAGGGDLADLLWRHVAQVVEPSLLPRLVELFGLAFLRGVTTFSLAELVNDLGVSVFEGGRIGFGSFRLRALFRLAGPGVGSGGVGGGAGAGAAVAFRHAAYQELLAAEFLRTASGRDAALAAAARPRVNEQVRAFLRARAGNGAADGPAGGQDG